MESIGETVPRADAAEAKVARVRALIEELHPRKTNVTHGCCAPPKLCKGHADECGGSHNFLNRPVWPCSDLRALRAALDER